MVTENSYISNGKYMGAVTLYGLSTDTKPTHFGNGSKFIEIDTHDEYYFDAVSGDWLGVPEPTPEPTPENTTEAKVTTKSTKK